MAMTSNDGSTLRGAIEKNLFLEGVDRGNQMEQLEPIKVPRPATVPVPYSSGVRVCARRLFVPSLPLLSPTSPNNLAEHPKITTTPRLKFLSSGSLPLQFRASCIYNAILRGHQHVPSIDICST